MGMFDDLPSAGESPSGLFDDIPSQSAAKLNAVEPPNWIEQQLAKITIPESANWGLNRARGFAMGAADPSVGAFQLAANVVGQGAPVNQAISDKEKQYEAERRGVGSEGFDFARMGGNVASPVNLLAASRLPMAATTVGRIGQGAAVGAAGGAAQPVTDADEGYWGTKALQTGLGAGLGAVATPIAGKLGDMVARKIEAPSGVNAAIQASQQTDEIITKALSEVGQTINDIPKPALDNLRKQVIDALKQGKQLDSAAILRKQDFDSVGMPSLLGQITRDPMQFAKELNLRGVQNLGEPITARLNEQNRVLQTGLGAFRNGAVDDAFVSGGQVSGAMKQADEIMRKHISGLYSAARQSTGKDLDVPLQGLAQDVAQVVSDFGDKVPSGVMNQFRALGLDPANPSNQKALFTIESADKILKVINDNVGADPATNRALDVLRASVKNAVISADSTGGPFAPAVAAAAKRFKMQDAIPALKAASEGSVAPDDFIRRFVINGKTEEVGAMAKVLRSIDPDAYAQARAQIGAHLNRAAFGENATADKVFSAERFNKVLREIGASKMKAFFSAAEIEQIQKLGRVGAYIHQAPPGSAVNSSNTAGAMMNLAGRIPGMPAAVGVAKAAKGAVDNAALLNRTLAAKPPVTPVAPARISDERAMMLRDLLAGGAFASGGLAAGFQR